MDEIKEPSSDQYILDLIEKGEYQLAVKSIEGKFLFDNNQVAGKSLAIQALENASQYLKRNKGQYLSDIIANSQNALDNGFGSDSIEYKVYYSMKMLQTVCYMEMGKIGLRKNNRENIFEAIDYFLALKPLQKEGIYSFWIGVYLNFCWFLRDELEIPNDESIKIKRVAYFHLNKILKYNYKKKEMVGFVNVLLGFRRGITTTKQRNEHLKNLLASNSPTFKKVSGIFKQGIPSGKMYHEVKYLNIFLHKTLIEKFDRRDRWRFIVLCGMPNFRKLLDNNFLEVWFQKNGRAVTLELLEKHDQKIKSKPIIKIDELPISGGVEMSPQSNVFQKDGETWQISFRGEHTRLKDINGLKYIHRLVSNPGKEIHVINVESGFGSPDIQIEADKKPAEKPISKAPIDKQFDVDESIDRQAIEEYKKKLIKIEEDSKEARDYGDEDEQDKLLTERKFLLKEISKHVKLGGTPKIINPDEEKARQRVRRGIMTAVKHIGRELPDLESFLRANIKTGIKCVYDSNMTNEVDWEL